ncbi:MAG: protein-arginine deiminase domain-containing protein [Actinomycetota bacterium]|nr:protein-arginine deiminase domain-containing protein [Actinomycetota bacterium]
MDQKKTSSRTAAALAASLVAVIAVAPHAGAEPRPGLANLVADTNRDGRVDLLGSTDQMGKAIWTADRGAIFLPNLDDDSLRCVVTEADMQDTAIETDLRLAKCTDAEDTVINGPGDLADLAPLRTVPAPGVSDTATGTVSLGRAQDTYARVWIERDGTWSPLGVNGPLTAHDLRTGATLALEGLDVIRDSRVWDGEVTLTLSVKDRGRTATDTVALRMAPLILQNDLRPASTILTSEPPPEYDEGYAEFSADLREVVATAGLPPTALSVLKNDDRWFQDIVEPATVSMPGPDGKPHVMRILLRSANFSADVTIAGTLRPAGKLLFATQRGADVGVVQQYTAERGFRDDDSLNSTGNFDSLPPYRDGRTNYPLGRSLYGSGTDRQPDTSFTTMLASQHARPIVMDTSWLLVGHVDETTHVIPARTERGWTIMVADPRLALNLMRQAAADGHGSARLYEGTSEWTKPTIDEALADQRFLDENEEAASRIDDQIAVLTRETGLRAEELVKAPVLFEAFSWQDLDGPAIQRHIESKRITQRSVDELQERMRAGTAAPNYFVAATASIPNGLSLTAQTFAAPDPHGPVVDGTDLFKRSTVEALRDYPVTVSWVEDWDFLHTNLGEVHCGTNALREPTRADWWTADH